MTELAWDQVADRRFETGVDRGVLYTDGRGVAWNGLRSVEDTTSRETKEFYQDGIKYLEHQVLSQYSGTLKAYTYPEEFEEILGVTPDVTGFHVHDQRAKSFGLCYRTRLGNHEGLDFGYRIHLLYNLRATPLTVQYVTVDSSVGAVEFGWQLRSTPVILPGYRPTAHLSFKSIDMEAERLALLEAKLYGTDISEPRLPPMEELLELVQAPLPPPLIITDHGDGTWSASGDQAGLIDEGTFLITGAPGEYLDENTYQIPTT